MNLSLGRKILLGLTVAATIVFFPTLAWSVWHRLTQVNADLGREAFPAGLIALGICALGGVTLLFIGWLIWRKIAQDRAAARPSGNG